MRVLTFFKMFVCNLFYDIAMLSAHLPPTHTHTSHPLRFFTCDFQCKPRRGMFESCIKLKKEEDEEEEKNRKRKKAKK